MKNRMILLFVFITALFILPAIFRPVAAPDEFRSAEIAREMLVSNNFLVPKVLGARFFEHLPMSYWLTAASFKVFGLNHFTLRFVSIASTLLSAALLLWWCLKRKYSLQTALNAAFLFLSGSIVCFFGSWEPLFPLSAMWVTASLVFAELALSSAQAKERLIWLAASGASMGCGFLTKGFSAILLPLLAIVLYLLLQRRWRDLFWLLPPIGTALIVILPWSILIHRAEPDFWNYWFSRAAVNFSGTNTVGYYIALLLILLGMFPGVLPVFFGTSAIKNENWLKFRNNAEMRFALCGTIAAVAVAVFSAPAEKFLPWVLPCFGTAAMFGAVLLDHADKEKLPAILRNLTTMCSVLFIIVGSLMLLAELFYLLWGTGFIPVLPLKYAVWAPFITTAALGMVVAGTVMFVNRKMKFPEPESFFMLFGICALICVWFLPGFTANRKMPEYELLGIGSKLSEKKISTPRIITTSQLMYSTAWCFRDSSVQLIGNPGEMYYGHRSALRNLERPLMLTVSETGGLLKNPKRREDIVIIVPNKDMNKYKEFLPPGEQMTSSGELCAFYYQGNSGRAEQR